MSWSVVAVTPVVWISGGWALSLVALLLVCMNCWPSRGGPVTHRPVHMHQSSALTSPEESRPYLPPPDGDPGILDHADSHGSYVNIQTDYVNIHHNALGTSPVNEVLYL
ncbi:uncharacterized protein LOC144769106 [Lissotriton helveticus]